VTAAIGNRTAGGMFGAGGTANLTTTFLTHFNPNQDGTLRVLAAVYNSAVDQYQITLDFSGLSGGFLPAGTIFSLADLDNAENFRGVKAYDPGGNQIQTAWLTPHPTAF
jgi:hypothetical protein